MVTDDVTVGWSSRPYEQRHSSVAFTYDRYGHLFPEADERSRARLDAVIGDATPAPTAEVREFRH
jgi:hypothetical protein